jgi:hypothetical protein
MPLMARYHGLEYGFGVERVHAFDYLGEAVAKGRRARGFDYGARDIRARDYFS